MHVPKKKGSVADKMYGFPDTSDFPDSFDGREKGIL